MITNRIIPCLLLNNSGLVKTTKFRDPVYVGDPINAVKIFNEKEVDELILLDIYANIRNQGPNFDLLNRIGKEAFMPMTYGGGIKSIGDVQKILNCGFEKISINYEFIKNPNLIEKISKEYGNQSLIVSIDIKKNFLGKYYVYNYKDGSKTDMDPVKFAIDAEKRGAGEILINSVDNDGTMGGYDLGIVKKISESLSIPLIALGGAGKIVDLMDVIKKGGASAAAAGAMFVFQGVHRAVLITYPDREDIMKISLENNSSFE